MKLTLDHLKVHHHILLSVISGSHAYGLNTPQSDTDYRGVFYLPREKFYSLNPIDQVAEDQNDVVYYELGRFIDLLSKNNPNILELLYTPQDCVITRHPLLDRIRPEWVLSKLCLDTFAGYARAQVQKAFGLNKKAMKPMSETRKSILDFCWIIEGHNATPLLPWLQDRGWQQEDCGLVNVPHMRDIYALFHAGPQARQFGFKGIAQKAESNSVSLSSVPKDMTAAATMSFNKDGYSVYCKEYAQYWEWVQKRNEARYTTTLTHGRGYDSKNMMHTFRLMAMAEEIAREGRVNVRRPDRDFLFQIRRGEFEYQTLIDMAEERMALMPELYAASSLPDLPDTQALENLLIELRTELYNSPYTAV